MNRGCVGCVSKAIIIGVIHEIVPFTEKTVEMPFIRASMNDCDIIYLLILSVNKLFCNEMHNAHFDYYLSMHVRDVLILKLCIILLNVQLVLR